jgi:predicted metal-dependent peptidase
MRDEDIAQAIAEVGGVLKATGHRDGVTVLSCDAAVRNCQRVFKPEQVKPLGGGGTEMMAGIEAAARLKPKPQVRIVVTDGWTAWADAPPKGMKVVVVLVGNGTAPQWARTVRIADN